MRFISQAILLFVITTIIILPQNNNSPKAHYDVFSFDKEVTLPGTPEIIFDAVTGDISGWWDHSMSGHPKKFYIEPFPGGGFYEIFDDVGNGVLHATVIYADRGKLLRFDGPLGLSGKAIQIVTTYTFEPVGTDSTLFKVSVHAAGEVDEGIPAIVERVWEHFIFEQLEPYIVSGKNLQK
jgi:hypothetical protein